MDNIEIVAGTISTTFFAASNVAMLVKAARTRCLDSYSYAYICLTNVANLVHWFYVAALPVGPIWFLHGFYTIAGALMLLWYLRYEKGLTMTQGTRGADTRASREPVACSTW